MCLKAVDPKTAVCTTTYLADGGFVERFLTISTNAGIMYVAQANPRIKPVMKREAWLLCQMSSTPRDQSIAIGTIEANSHILGSGSIFSMLLHSGYAISPASSPK